MAQHLFDGSLLELEVTTGNWVAFGAIISASGFDSQMAMVDISSAASEFMPEEIPDQMDPGVATFEMFYQPTSTFQQTLRSLWVSGAEKSWRVRMPSGTLNGFTFSGYISDRPLSGQYRDVWRMTLALKMTTELTPATLAPI